MKTWQPIFMTVTAAGFAWQGHSWVWGAVVAVLMALAVPLATSAMFYLSIRNIPEDDEGGGVLAIARRGVWVRWTIYVVVMVGIALTGAEIVTP